MYRLPRKKETEVGSLRHGSLAQPGQEVQVEQLEVYHLRRKAALLHLGGVCVVCGTTERLELDHIDPATKRFSFGQAYKQREEIFWEEVDKCQLLCKTHHVEKTNRNHEHAGGHNRISNPEHGTWAMYTNFKCRCAKCKKWRSDYRKQLVHCDGSERSEHPSSSGLRH